MDSFSQFRTLEDLVNCLSKERKLLRDIFGDRKTHVYSMDLAMELVEHRRERIQYLIDYGVIHESGNFLELEDIYLKFFEEVLDVNEEINIASVKECIDSLKENITYYLKETNEKRKYQYLYNIRKKLRDTGLRTLKNVIDLKRNVDTAYKQEPNYDIKKQRLKNLDEKKISIETLIKECEKLIDTDKAFFSLTHHRSLTNNRVHILVRFAGDRDNDPVRQANDGGALIANMPHVHAEPVGAGGAFDPCLAVSYDKSVAAAVRALDEVFRVLVERVDRNDAAVHAHLNKRSRFPCKQQAERDHAANQHY